jgi:hypothetical protein
MCQISPIDAIARRAKQSRPQMRGLHIARPSSPSLSSIERTARGLFSIDRGASGSGFVRYGPTRTERPAQPSAAHRASADLRNKTASLPGAIARKAETCPGQSGTPGSGLALGTQFLGAGGRDALFARNIFSCGKRPR